MATATASTSLVPVQPVLTDAERLALAGFPAGCRSLTRETCTLDLRQFTASCRARFYRYAVEEELLDHSPAANVRRPRLDCESHATALDRGQITCYPRISRRSAGAHGRLRTAGHVHRAQEMRVRVMTDSTPASLQQLLSMRGAILCLPESKRTISLDR
jgi:hypothetical protein